MKQISALGVAYAISIERLQWNSSVAAWDVRHGVNEALDRLSRDLAIGLQENERTEFLRRCGTKEED